MPIFDKPLPELHDYQGRNPRPSDIEAFWEGGLTEVRHVDPDAELRSSHFQAPHAECFHLYFTGTGGARIHAKYLRPKGAEMRGKHPLILLFHGYTNHSGDWFDKLAWVGQGFCVAAMDCRGQGGLSNDPGGVRGNTLHGHIIRGLDEDEPQKLLFRNIFLDTVQLARVVSGFDEVDPERLGAVGASQGGGLTLACAALEPRIKRAVPIYPFLCDYQRVWEMDLAKDAYHELQQYFRRFDPRHERETEIFTRLGYIDCQHLAHRIRAKVLMGVGLMDTVCPPSTQFAAYNKITSPKELAIYPDFAHEALPGMADKVYAFMEGL